MPLATDNARFHEILDVWTRWAGDRWGPAAVEPVRRTVTAELLRLPDAPDDVLETELERAVSASPELRGILLDKLAWRVREEWPELGATRARDTVEEVLVGVDLRGAIGDDQALGEICRIVVARTRILRAEHITVAARGSAVDASCEELAASASCATGTGASPLHPTSVLSVDPTPAAAPPAPSPAGPKSFTLNPRAREILCELQKDRPS